MPTSHALHRHTALALGAAATLLYLLTAPAIPNLDGLGYIKLLPHNFAAGHLLFMPALRALTHLVGDGLRAGRLYDALLGGTGVGITPVLPMIAELVTRPERGRILLYWGNRHAEDLFWLDELKELQAQSGRLAVEIFLTGDAPDWPGRRGRINQAILTDLPTLDKPVFYLVGNGAMIREVKAALQERGVDRKRQIRNEAFFG